MIDYPTQNIELCAKDEEIEMLKAEWHAEIERSKFYATVQDKIIQIKDLQIEGLLLLVGEALKHALEHHGWFSATAEGAAWIREVRKVVDSARKETTG